MKDYPPGFAFLDDKHVLKEPNDYALTSDSVCWLFHHSWWEQYQSRREAAMKEADPQAALSIQFTRYPSIAQEFMTVPVESILGEPFGPRSVTWRKGKWGCYFGCQDLRKTIEWVLALEVELSGIRKVHVRARWTFALLCPPGMISREVSKRSMREFETGEELEAAFTLHKKLTWRAEKATEWDNLTLYGLTGIIKGCECFVPTKEERDEALVNISKRSKPTTSLTRRYNRQRYYRGYVPKDHSNPHQAKKHKTGTEVDESRSTPAADTDRAKINIDQDDQLLEVACRDLPSTDDDTEGDRADKEMTQANGAQIAVELLPLGQFELPDFGVWFSPYASRDLN